MATSQQLAQQIERLLASGANNQVLGLCDTAIATSKREIEAWLGRAKANLAMARVCVADEDLDMALRLAPFSCAGEVACNTSRQACPRSAKG